MQRRIYIALIAAAMTAVGCSLAPGFAERTEEYRLIQVNGEPLPYVRGPFLPLCGPRRGTLCEDLPECDRLIIEGALRLKPSRRTATLWYKNIVNCPNYTGHTFSATGKYQINGQTLEISAGQGDAEYTGTIEGDQIELKIGQSVYVFRRK